MNAIPAPDLPVAVIGAGPIGLVAAARLVERGLRPAVFEKPAVPVAASACCQSAA